MPLNSVTVPTVSNKDGGYEAEAWRARVAELKAVARVRDAAVIDRRDTPPWWQRHQRRYACRTAQGMGSPRRWAEGLADYEQLKQYLKQLQVIELIDMRTGLLWRADILGWPYI
jgi:hypothetical protein